MEFPTLQLPLVTSSKKNIGQVSEPISVGNSIKMGTFQRSRWPKMSIGHQPGTRYRGRPGARWVPEISGTGAWRRVPGTRQAPGSPPVMGARRSFPAPMSRYRQSRPRSLSRYFGILPAVAAKDLGDLDDPGVAMGPPDFPTNLAILRRDWVGRPIDRAPSTSGHISQRFRRPSARYSAQAESRVRRSENQEEPGAAAATTGFTWIYANLIRDRGGEWSFRGACTSGHYSQRFWEAAADLRPHRG